MSDGKKFQRTDAATRNERRPTVDRRKGRTWSGEAYVSDLIVVFRQ